MDMLVNKAKPAAMSRIGFKNVESRNVIDDR
jgi:hypothetical protein